MKLRHLLSGMAICCAAHSSAYAQGSDELEGLSQASLQDLKAKCQDYISNPQMKQVKAKLYCNEQSFYWRPGAPLPSQLKNYKQIGVRVQLKTLQTQQQFAPVAIPDTAIQCQSYVKVQREVLPLEVEVTCENLLQISNLTAFCQDQLAARVKQDPGMVQEMATNESLTLCPH